jgi:hypothetical protein
MREIRRDLHKNLELGMEEVRTSGIIAKYLSGPWTRCEDRHSQHLCRRNAVYPRRE